MEEPNFKGLLQIHCQKVRVALPQYSCTQSMKDGRAVFLANVTVLGQSFTSEAEFSNKKQAEKSAAKVALLELGILTTDKLNLNPSGDPAQKVGQTCIERNPVSPTTAAEKPHEDEPAASVCSPEVHEKGSVKDPGLASPEVQTSSPPPIAQTLTLRKNSNSVSFKNILQERAHKMGLALPQYETTKEVKGFVCTVTFDGRSFKSDGFLPGKKLAEQNAASLALEVLVTEEKSLGESPVVGDKTIYDASVSYKNLLQENCQQRGHKQPVYSTTWEGSGFFSIVQIGNKTASSKISYVTKKKAEQIAAREALLSIGVSNPEEVYNSKAAKKSKLKRKFAPTADHQRTSWVHSRGGQGLHSSEWTEVDYFWEQAIGKRQKLDPSESCAISRRNFGARTFSIPLDHRRDLTVGEIWKEKKNIAIVGDAEGSFILYCMRFPGTCNIFNTRTMSLVLLEPGYRIIGLDAHYSEHYGKVALQAERCADVIIPETPDPVLTSCGFVLLFQDPQSSSIQVLLKRYLSSPAFVNVAAALAQYFRRRVSGRPVWLDIESITEHISDWMLEEVQNIATMNKEALENVFSYMWKFNKRWCSVLDHPLPNDLQVLKARAADELARRQANGFHHSEDYYRPWSLPKGNFKHRMLSTGLFIEPPAECAVRELKEETGIKLDADEIKNCPQIDLLQKDNLNPHKGDMAKYFLYVYSPDSIEDEVSVSLDQMNTSLEYETSSDQDTVPQFPLLDASSDQVTVEKGQEENKFKDNTQRHVCSSNVDITQQNTSNQMEGHPASESMSVHLEIDEDKKRRGVKRKRDEDDDDDNAAYQGINSTRLQDTHGETLPGQSSCDKSLDVVSTPGNKQEMITARSPHVQGSVHEECAWFTIEEARVKSPIFEQIYQTEQFTELLNSF